MCDSSKPVAEPKRCEQYADFNDEFNIDEFVQELNVIWTSFSVKKKVETRYIAESQYLKFYSYEYF